MTYIYSTLVEAIFPVSSTERDLFAVPPHEMSLLLPPAPPYAGLTVPLPDVTSLFAYKDPRVTALVWNIKYRRSMRAVRIGGYALYRHMRGQLKPGTPRPVILIPLPITRQRRRERGFNQCELLTDEIIRLDELGEAPGTFLAAEDILVRARHDSRHTLKGRAERLESVRGIFAVNEAGLRRSTRTGEQHIHDAPVIVVDDVITTGSTMKEAVDTLRSAGFRNVRGVSLAH